MRTTEPVSLRATACYVALAAVCGVALVAVGACVVAGAVLFVAWATLRNAASKTAPASTDFAKEMLFISTSSSIEEYKGIDKNTFIQCTCPTPSNANVTNWNFDFMEVFW